MITIDQVINVLPIVALTISILYYAMVLRNQNKTSPIIHAIISKKDHERMVGRWMGAVSNGMG